MAEAEDVVTDVARHATVYVQALWRRRREAAAPALPTLTDVADHLDLLLHASLGQRFTLRAAQPPAPPTLLEKLFRRVEAPYPQHAVPATDGRTIWLPARLEAADPAGARTLYRTLALQQAMRARRGAAALVQCIDSPLQRSLFLLLEAWAADSQLIAQLPGLHAAIQQQRNQMLAARPPLARFSAARQPLEAFLRRLLQSRSDTAPDELPATFDSYQALQLTARLAAR
ncbi:protein NorD2, partial [Stutzerimonas degradans]